ncbi:hypothetical protein GCM10022252_79150 [Streptosporangium oxazolinicum]|uniref:Solute-binding protein family 5 domain-containing protein n=1 Tax=Streptosporangium oxazolinicum TaxID=909287 RepID=A0ABP8BP74_9ACTN
MLIRRIRSTCLSRAALVWAAALGVLATACTGGGPPGGAGNTSPVPGGRLVYAVEADANGFDPVRNPYTSQTFAMGGTIIESLAALDAQGRWRPFLAEEIVPHREFEGWTIRLRRGISFTNGEALTAKVVGANLEAQRRSPLSAVVMRPLASVKVTDERTVEVLMSEPWATFPYYLAGQLGLMVPVASLRDPGAAARHPVGTGPFRLRTYTPGSRFVVTRNPRYWRSGLPFLDEIEFRVVPDPRTKSQALKAGGVDVVETGDEDFATFQKLAKDRGHQIFRPAGMSVQVYHWRLNTAVPPLDDVRVRRAMAHATDRRAHISALRSGLTTEAEGPWSQDTPWYAPTDYPEHDPARAKALIDEYKREKRGGSVTILTSTDRGAVRNAELARDTWRRAGLDVRIEEADQATLHRRIATGRFHVGVGLSYSASDPDGETYTSMHSKFASPVGTIATNVSRIRDLRLDDALDRGRSTDDLVVRRQAYTTVQRRVNELVPFIWIDHLSTVGVIASPKVRGITDHTLPDGAKGLPLNGRVHPFAQIWIQP